MSELRIDDQMVASARAQLMDGATPDEILDQLRRRGIDKVGSIEVVRTAMDLSLADAQHLVHNSPVWADHRESDEHLQDAFWRAAFILCLIDGGQVNEPAEWVTEFRERQQRAAEQLREAAAGLPDDALVGYRERAAQNRFGDAFAALVAAGQQYGIPTVQWQALAAAAETLCLNELGAGDDLGLDDDLDNAIRVVRRYAHTPA